MRKFTAVVTREGKIFVAKCAEVELASQGGSVDEAVANLREALELLYEDEAPPSVEPAIVRQLEAKVA